jgi:hypothetical protein
VINITNFSPGKEEGYSGENGLKTGGGKVPEWFLNKNAGPRKAGNRL